MGSLYALTASLVWSANPILLKKALEVADPLRIHAFRILSIAVLLLPWALWHREVPPSPTVWALLAGAALSGPLLAWGGYILALQRLPVSVAHPLVNSYPLFAILMEILIWGVWPPLQGWAGATLILAGIALLQDTTGETRPPSSHPTASPWVGILLGLATSFLWGLTSVLFKMLVSHLSVYGIVFWRSVLASLFLLPVAGWRPGGHPRPFPPRARIFAALSGWLNDVVGLWFYLHALRIAPLYLVVPLSSLSPVLAYVWARRWLREPFRMRRWLAILAVIGGTLLLSR